MEGNLGNLPAALAAAMSPGYPAPARSTIPRGRWVEMSPGRRRRDWGRSKYKPHQGRWEVARRLPLVVVETDGETWDICHVGNGPSSPAKATGKEATDA